MDPETLAHRDLLIVLAEVSAAFMGFSMVVGLLRADSPLERVRFLSVRDVAEISFIAVFTALLPLVVAHYGASEPLVWRASSALAAAVWGLGLASSMQRKGWSNPEAPWRQSRVLGVAGVLVNFAGLALHGWNVLAPTRVAGARYVTALALLLGIAGTMFIHTAFQQRPDSD